MAAVILDPFTKVIDFNFGPPFWLGIWGQDGGFTSNPPSGPLSVLFNTRGGTPIAPGNILPFSRTWPFRVERAEPSSSGAAGPLPNAPIDFVRQGLLLVPLPGNLPFGLDMTVTYAGTVAGYALIVGLIASTSQPPVLGQTINQGLSTVGLPVDGSKIITKVSGGLVGSQTFHVDPKRFSIT